MKYHMFWQLKKDCVDEDWQVMMNLRPQAKRFLADKVRRLAKRYTKCVEKKRVDCFQKLYILH